MSVPAVLRLGTRKSPMAMTQSGLVARAITERTGVPVELVGVTTRGDVDRAQIAQIGGTGVWVSALRDQLLTGRVDLAVHSLKDLPTGQPDGIALAAVPARDDPRDALIARAFRGKHADESHRARLRVEVGRLRMALRPLAGVSATAQGFVLVPRGAREVVVLARPVEEEHAAVLAFLADGESWSSSALALALGASQRTVQRALESLAAAGKVQSFGHGRARRWMTPSVPGFPTTLLLPAPLPSD